MKNLKEEEIITNIDDNISDILAILRDDNFGNQAKRNEFGVLISTLAISKDPRARKVIKELGNYLTDLSDKLLNTDPEEKVLGNNFKTIDEGKVKKYKSIYKEVSKKDLINKLNLIDQWAMNNYKTKESRKISSLIDTELNDAEVENWTDYVKQDYMQAESFLDQLNRIKP